MTKNNFNKDVKMHLACDGNDFRPAMNCIYFKGDFAYASNDKVLVKNRISEISGLDDSEIKALDGKYLHKGFYEDMLKYDNITISDDGIECSKGVDKVFFYFSEIGPDFDKYPNAEKLLQDVLNMQTVPLSYISFDINLLQILNNALYSSSKCFATFKGVLKPILFNSADPDVSSIGLLCSYNSERYEDSPEHFSVYD